MKENDFRSQRREEKRRAYEMKKARLAAAREKLRAAKANDTRTMAPYDTYGDSLDTPATGLFVGRLEYVKRGGIIFPEARDFRSGIVIPASHLNGANEGDKVVVRVFEKCLERLRGVKNGLEGLRSRGLPEGEVVRILGQDGENDAEMNAILIEYGLPTEYPDIPLDIPKEIPSEEVLRRRDMRDVLTFTIDPQTAKDFDDALSFRIQEDGSYEVGVHIADVTHYVRPDTEVDEEAYQRATSVYLVDRTVPMLPELLSNDVCSLRPNEDKLTYSVVFVLDEKAHVLKYKICQTVIRSRYRLTYEQAQEIIDTDSPSEAGGVPRRGEGVDQPPTLSEALHHLNDLAKQLRDRRLAAGAIAFEREEVVFDLDEQGHPVGLRRKPSLESNFLIEEFMLLANRTVATYVGKELNRPFVYRVHDVPDPDKVEALTKVMRTIGHAPHSANKATGTNKSGKALNRLLQSVDGPEKNMLTLMAVRAMAKAVYSTDNIGHYGLAFTHYTHFTSPIRRSPDMMVHRLLKHYTSKSSAADAEWLETRCKHCSEMEQHAAAAERASIKYKQVEFMQDKVGQVFDGVITGVTDWGVYVEIAEFQCEGLVAMRDLRPEDYYDYVEDEYSLRGRIHDRAFRLGDSLRVKVARADLEKKQLDFALA